jgi:hypothetical protein
MKKTLISSILIIFALLPVNLSAQKNAASISILNAPQYAVHFKDKENSPFSIFSPLEFLSQRAIDRREKFGIAVTIDDLPVNPNYIMDVSLTGAYVSNSSRWSNSVLVYADDDMINAIQNLDFVKKIVYVKPAEGKFFKYDVHPKWKNEDFFISHKTTGDYEYGSAFNQIKQLNGIPVHKYGYTGKDVFIAVLDGGFQKADQVVALTHLFESGRIVMEKNVVKPNESIYDVSISGHGTSVLSCMGGFIEGNYIGTSPSASYALIRTEDTPTEYLIEEYFWMIGAEIADSLGVDILNSSLSYTTFDDSSMDHTYLDMDGKTAISSIAAKMAVERGIFATISAGNSNGSAFPWVGSPADMPEALTIGAVNLSGEIASFSSIGPNGAGSPKPNTLACGWGAFVISPNNNIYASNGTSFSSPITCGMVACVIQAAPDKTPAEILDAVQQSAHRYPVYDIQYGYGIPDFEKVLQILGVLSIENITTTTNLTCYPNPVKDKLYLRNDTKIIKNVEFYDIAGKLIKSVNNWNNDCSVNITDISAGFILVKVNYDKGESETVKCVIL